MRIARHEHRAGEDLHDEIACRDAGLAVSAAAAKHEPAQDNPSVTDDHVAVARDVTRSSVLDQLGLGGAQAESGGKHGDCWSESAHADLFFHDDVIKSARIEGENLVNGFVVLYAGDLVVFVMIHVARCKNKDAVAPPGYNFSNGTAKALQSFVAARAEGDGNESDAGF